MPCWVKTPLTSPDPLRPDKREGNPNSVPVERCHRTTGLVDYTTCIYICKQGEGYTKQAKSSNTLEEKKIYTRPHGRWYETPSLQANIVDQLVVHPLESGGHTYVGKTMDIAIIVTLTNLNEKKVLRCWLCQTPHCKSILSRPRIWCRTTGAPTA
jgi:hypothetical protein